MRMAARSCLTVGFERIAELLDIPGNMHSRNCRPVVESFRPFSAYQAAKVQRRTVGRHQARAVGALAGDQSQKGADRQRGWALCTGCAEVGLICLRALNRPEAEQ
jgi:hypothetical protein